MPQIIAHYLPELDEPERSFIERLTAGMSHESIQQFAAAYRQVRKDPQTLRLMAIIGILGGQLKSGHVWSPENRP